MNKLLESMGYHYNFHRYGRQHAISLTGHWSYNGALTLSDLFKEVYGDNLEDFIYR